MLNKPIVLSGDECVLPVYLNQVPAFGLFRDVFRELDPLRGAHMFVSTDAGQT